VRAVERQSRFLLGKDLAIHVTDNGSTDSTFEIVSRLTTDYISVSRNHENLGFSAAHNQGVHRAVVGRYDYVLFLNPDVALEQNALATMLQGFLHGNDIATVTPKLLRCNDELSPLEPKVIDAAGMELQSSLRHFDRGSGSLDQGQFDEDRFVFGGTGACLLVSVPCAWSVSLPYFSKGDAVSRLYPQIERATEPRIQLFDEGFFAYREDADLAWRLRLLGWRCRYISNALAYHVRVVVPERRENLPPLLNCLSVRNRFLLQIQNWRWSVGEGTFLHGVLIRNVIVIGGVLVREWSSLPGLFQALRMFRRALRHRRVIKERQKEIFGRSPAVTLQDLNDS
jgi:GT2 family glycosyltransferase